MIHTKTEVEELDLMREHNKREEKKLYFAQLRERWAENKKSAEGDADARARYDAIIAEAPDFKMSFYSFYFTLQSMHAQGLDGTPYIDTKTFNGWIQSGFKVKKGEHSVIDGITWIASNSNSKSEAKKKDDGFVYPKIYKLFHRTQVEAIK